MKLSRKISTEIAKAFIVVIIICICILIPWQNKKAQVLNQKLITLMQTFISKDMGLLANAIFEKRDRAIEIRVQDILSIEGIENVFIFDETQKVLSDSGKPSPIQPGDFHFQKASLGKLSTWTSKNSLFYLQAIPAIDETIGFVLIEYSLADMNKKETLSILLFTVIIVMLILILLIMTNRLIRKIILRPVDQLIESMSEIEKGCYGSQIGMMAEDEIGELAKKFNTMSFEIDTSYKQIEQQNEQLRQTKNLLDSIINSMPSILIHIDDQCRIKEWNTRARKAAGITLSEAKGKVLNQVFPIIGNRMADIKKTLTGKASRKFSKVEILDENKPCYYDILVYPIVSESVEQAVIIIEDITDLVRMETIMIQTEKMMSVGGLAAGMAHEINNPLAGMIQNAQVIHNRMIKDLPANLKAAQEIGISMDLIRQYIEKRQVEKLLEAVKTSGSRAAQIVKNMLSFSRQSADQFSACNMGELMDATIELSENDYDLKKKFDFRQINIIREYAIGNRTVECEANKIQQVFFNILKNGAEAMAEEKSAMGKQSAAIGKKYFFILRIKDQDSQVHIEIQDNGPGMTEQVAKRIFEPFYTTKEVGVGTGLGLSVSYFIIVENHKGEMSVESIPGGGAKFIIKLPWKHKFSRTSDGALN